MVRCGVRVMHVMRRMRVTRVTRAMHADADGGVDVDMDVDVDVDAGELRRATHTQDPLSWLRLRSGVSPTAS